jgi:hypothetical protein
MSVPIERDTKSPLSKFTPSRETKKKIVDTVESWCGKTNISKKTVGIIVRSLHVSSPILFFTILIYGSYLNVMIIILFSVCVFIMFLVNNGCLLTMLEHRLCGDNFTTVDPFIEYYGMELSNSNRVNVTIITCLMYFLIISILYYYRFCM